MKLSIMKRYVKFTSATASYFNMSPTRSLFLIFIAGLTGGSVYPLIKIAESYDIPKFAYIFWESLFVFCILFGINGFKDKQQFLQKSATPYYVFCAFTNILIPQTLFFIIAPNLDASILSLIIVLTPIFVYLASLLLKDDNFIWSKIFGVIFGFTGVAILFIPELDTNKAQWTAGWILFAMLVPLNYTLNRVFATKVRPQECSSVSLAAGLFGVVCILSGTLMFFHQDLYAPIDLNLGTLALVGHSVLMTIFYIIFFDLAKLSALHNSLSFYIAPLIGILWGVLLFEEILTIFFVIATILVFTGLFLINQPNKN